MSVTQVTLLGIIQGLTEFIPVSSSGHLVLIPYFLNWRFAESDAFIFDVLVQVATLLAVLVYYREDFWSIAKAMVKGIWQRRPFDSLPARLGWFLILATIPAGLIGLALKSKVEQAFSNPLATAIFLLGTALLLLVAERLGRRRRDWEQITWADALWMGFFQALAIFPGLSRSGAVITGGMLRNLKRPPAARFTFLMSFPIMLAAGMVAFLDLLRLPDVGSQLVTFLPGFVVAALTGYLAIRWLVGYLSKHPLYIFSIYCTAIALLTLLVYWLRR